MISTVGLLPASGIGSCTLGPFVSHPARVDAAVLRALNAVAPLAPLHQPRALELARRVSARWADGHPGRLPGHGVPHPPTRCCCDASRADGNGENDSDCAGTGSTGSPWRGRSDECSRCLPDARHVVVAHLGAGASLTAVLDGRSVDDPTMGFTPLGGLVMATRSSTLDPGMPLWLVHEGLDPAKVWRDLESWSASWRSPAPRTCARCSHDGPTGDREAAAGFDVYAYRVARDLTGPGSCGHALVVTSREDIEIADQVVAVLSRTTGP